MTQVIGIIDSNLDLMTQTFGSQLKSRLILHVMRDFCEERFIASHYSYIPSRPLSGIISFLAHKDGGKVHDDGIVELRSSIRGNNADDYPLKNVFDFETISHVWTDNLPNQWICF
jgi:hypothetical protein